MSSSTGTKGRIARTCLRSIVVQIARCSRTIGTAGTHHTTGPSASRTTPSPGWRVLGNGVDMTLQHRMIGHRGKDQTFFVIILTEYFVFAQIETVTNTESVMKDKWKKQNKDMSYMETYLKILKFPVAGKTCFIFLVFKQMHLNVK